jgi:RimJ/RimL family protein N-acetyltransferase
MFARTERLLLRPGWLEDAPALARAIGDEAIVRNLARVPWPYRVGDAEAFLSAPFRADEARLLIFRRTKGAPQLIGGTGFERDEQGNVELGYWIGRPHWGLGYATEAVRAMVDIARHSLRRSRLTAGHFIDNPASGRVLEKAGFRPSGRLVQRFSAGRRESVPCKLFEMAISDTDDLSDADVFQSRCDMLAA